MTAVAPPSQSGSNCDTSAVLASATAYYDESSAQYASARWVQEVADHVARAIHRFRPFTRDDIIVDYGCGPGITLEKIFYLNHSLQHTQHQPNPPPAAPAAAVPASVSDEPLALLGRHARICDLSQQAISMSRNLASVRCPLKGVWCDWMTAFDGPTSDRLTSDFLAWLPPHIDVAYSSLVAEYLTFEQTLALSKVLLDRLEDDGVLAWFDWSEHPSYEPQHLAGIHQPTGLSKASWLRLASLLVDHVELPDARMQHHQATQDTLTREGCFLPLPDWRLTFELGSIDVQLAIEQTVPSSDVMHYLLVKKNVTASNRTFRKLVVPR